MSGLAIAFPAEVAVLVAQQVILGTKNSTLPLMALTVFAAILLITSAIHLTCSICQKFLLRSK